MTNGRRQVLSRAVQHLYLMEVTCSDDGGKDSVVQEQDGEKRVKRSAALDAEWKIRAMLDS